MLKNVKVYIRPKEMAQMCQRLNNKYFIGIIAVYLLPLASAVLM